jgi:hypothetical protein
MRWSQGGTPRENERDLLPPAGLAIGTARSAFPGCRIDHLRAAPETAVHCRAHQDAGRRPGMPSSPAKSSAMGTNRSGPDRSALLIRSWRGGLDWPSRLEHMPDRPEVSAARIERSRQGQPGPVEPAGAGPQEALESPPAPPHAVQPRLTSVAALRQSRPSPDPERIHVPTGEVTRQAMPQPRRRSRSTSAETHNHPNRRNTAEVDVAIVATEIHPRYRLKGGRPSAFDRDNGAADIQTGETDQDRGTDITGTVGSTHSARGRSRRYLRRRSP